VESIKHLFSLNNAYKLHERNGKINNSIQDKIRADLAYSGQVTGQEDRAEKLLEYCNTPRTRREMQEFIEIASREYFNKTILLPLLESGKLKMIIPDKPNSRNQKYVRV
jgi:ATP-dependent DNA helicase RecG